MNIQDVEAPTEFPEDIIQAIFHRQRELMHKYHPIEKSNGLLLCEDIPVNLHDRFGQARLKDMAWRMTEELTEATTACTDDHYQEEVIDAFHFFVELSILCNYFPNFPYESVNRKNGVYPVIERVGCAMNTLKNKPWKQTNMLTDVPEFYRNISEAWIAFFELFRKMELSLEDVYCLYFKKSEVNKFRQRSKY